MTLIRRTNRDSPRKQRAKRNLDGSPRKKPGPKPRSIDLSAAADPLHACIAAYEAAADPAAAATAFRRSIPPLATTDVSTWAGIVAQGLARRVWTGKEASTMLYAAQIARRR